MVSVGKLKVWELESGRIVVRDGDGKFYLVRSFMDALILKRRDYLYYVPSVFASWNDPIDRKLRELRNQV